MSRSDIERAFELRLDHVPTWLESAKWHNKLGREEGTPLDEQKMLFEAAVIDAATAFELARTRGSRDPEAPQRELAAAYRERGKVRAALGETAAACDDFVESIRVAAPGDHGIRVAVAQLAKLMR